MKLIKYFLAIFVFSFVLGLAVPVLAAETSTLEGLNSAAQGIPAYQPQIKDTAKTVVINKVGNIVSLILSFVGVVFLILTIYAGLTWMTAQGNSAQVDKAKDLLINAVIGLVIVTAAYSITSFVGTSIVGK